MTLVLGIDDAGRGPAIGPMVLAGVLIGRETERIFEKLGVKDSKQLTPRRRELLAEEIKSLSIGCAVKVFSAKQINKMMTSKINLNSIEAMGVAKVINKLCGGRDEEIKVIIDCPSVNTSSWMNKVFDFLKSPENLKFVCEHKADLNYISVAAASIVAKVKRDDEIKKLKDKTGMDIGSGYPSDPLTKSFLDNYYDKFKDLEIFRDHWRTIKKINKKIKSRNAKLKQKRLGEF